MLVHCNMKVRPDVIQFLCDDDIFMERKLEIATCPKCLKLLARLTERRKTDSLYFEASYSEDKARRLIDECSGDIMYTSDDFKQKKVLYGWIYGENKESINKNTGEVTITQKSCDFNGVKKVIKKECNIKLNNNPHNYSD